MPTYAEATFLRSHINSFIGLLLVGSFSLWMGLLIWQTATGENPLAKAMAGAIYQEQLQSLTN